MMTLPVEICCAAYDGELDVATPIGKQQLGEALGKCVRVRMARRCAKRRLRCRVELAVSLTALERGSQLLARIVRGFHRRREPSVLPRVPSEPHVG